MASFNRQGVGWAFMASDYLSSMPPGGFMSQRDNFPLGGGGVSIFPSLGPGLDTVTVKGAWYTSTHYVGLLGVF